MKVMQALVVTTVLFVSSALVEAKRATPMTEEERTVVQVFDAPGSTKDQVHSAAKMWIAENFKSAKSVIEYENKDEGIIVGNGSIAYPCTGGFTCRIRSESWRVSFTMKLEAKDGRFRLSFSNVLLDYPPYNNMGVTRAAYAEPVSSRSDMDNIRVKLLAFGPQIVATLGKAKADENW